MIKPLLLSASLALLAFIPTTMDAQNTPGQVTAGPANNTGILYASAFGQWQVTQGNNGAYAWTSPNQCNATANGIPLNPVFKVGTPIRIVDANPALSETVTVTTVRYGPLGCSIQLVPLYQHYSFYITSATAGLQEAINWAAGLPYQIVTTPDWTRLGGITSYITSATGNANVQILDQRTTSLCAYAWSGSAYTAQGCAGNSASLTQTALQTFAGPLDIPAGITFVNDQTTAAFGDSLTAGNEGVVQIDNFPSLLQTNIGTQVNNYGVGGTTSTQIAVRAGATASSIQKSSGNIPACTTSSCSASAITVGFPLGYEPTANSTTGGGGVVNVTGTIATTPAIHGTISLSLYQGTTTWSIAGGTATINGLVLVAGASNPPTTGMAIEANGLTGATGCSDLNGPHILTGGTSSTASFATSCTGSGTGGVVSIYTFTPDSYTPGATISGTPTWTTDSPCPSCSIIAWPGRNNLFTNGSYPSGISVVEGSVAALAAIVPATKQFVVMPVIPENISSEWSSGGNYATLTAYQSFLASAYPNNYVNVWGALLNAGIPALPTDAIDIANGNIPTSLRAVTATGTLAANVLVGDSSIQINVTAGIIAANQVVTLDVGSSTLSENVLCTTVTGSANPYTISGCTRNYGGSPTGLAHSSGATINQDDGTHLNAKGYGVVATAIANHLGLTAGTSPATTPQLNRLNLLGGVGVQEQVVNGQATAGLQWVFGGPTSSIRDSVGTVEATAITGAGFMAYNANQNGGYGIDQWHQPLQSQVSYLALMSASGWGLYHALSTASDNPFATFWSGPDVTLSRSAATFNVQAAFNTSVTTFANSADSSNTLIVQAGSTADQNAIVQFNDKTNTCKWQILKEGTFNSLRNFDCVNSLARFIETPNGSTVINAGNGANAIQFNATAGSGTLGVTFGSGTGSTVATIDGSGNGAFNGTVTGTTAVKVATGVAMTGNQGIGTLVQHSTGSTTNNDCVKFNTNGDVVDSGAVCGAAGLTVTITTTNAVTISGTNGNFYNQDATAAAAITYTLPTPAAGLQFCVKNSNNGSAANTGALELLVANTGTQSIILNGTKSSSGFIISSGAAGDAACVVGISTTQWEAYTQVGTWTLH